MQIKTTSKFEKQYALMIRRGAKIDLLQKCIELFVETKTLPPAFRLHKLKGNYLDYMNAIFNLIGF